MSGRVLRYSLVGTHPTGMLSCYVSFVTPVLFYIDPLLESPREFFNILFQFFFFFLYFFHQNRTIREEVILGSRATRPACFIPAHSKQCKRMRYNKHITHTRDPKWKPTDISHHACATHAQSPRGPYRKKMKCWKIQYPTDPPWVLKFTGGPVREYQTLNPWIIPSWWRHQRDRKWRQMQTLVSTIFTYHLFLTEFSSWNLKARNYCKRHFYPILHILHLLLQCNSIWVSTIRIWEIWNCVDCFSLLLLCVCSCGDLRSSPKEIGKVMSENDTFIQYCIIIVFPLCGIRSRDV